MCSHIEFLISYFCPVCTYLHAWASGIVDKGVRYGVKKEGNPSGNYLECQVYRRGASLRTSGIVASVPNLVLRFDLAPPNGDDYRHETGVEASR